ncbi:MAG: anchored repeat-type ABC transporter ATP-binding subunit [Dermatophilaceae bacterium]
MSTTLSRPETTVAAPALAMRRIGVRLGGRTVLTGVDLDLASGRLTSLLGPNGAGKTTLLRAALGLVRYTGEVVVGGEPLQKRASARIGYVPQRHTFDWDYPVSVHGAVLNALLVTRRRRRATPAEYCDVAAALGRVGLTELSDRPIGQLSGGQRQRVLLARALAAGPRVLLLDEPLTGLDLPSQETLTALFATLAGQGESLLVATHDVHTAMATSDVVVLLRGRVIAHGPPARLRTPEPWQETYGVGPGSLLLHQAGVASC